MSKATQCLPFQGTKRSQQFIEKYRKKLEDGFDFFNPDTSMMSVEKYNTSKLKMLLVFPTPKEVKTVSSTAAAINDYIIEHCPDVFLDFAFMPDGSDIKLYDDNNIPYAIGYITHLDASYFDVVGFSISVLHEIITGPVILRSFDRCDKPIPLFWSDRKNMKIGETPLVYAGGITAACGDVMFGKVGDKESFMDFLYLGACDKTDIILNRYIQARDNHMVIRKQEDHDIGGYPHHDEPNFVEEIKVETIQDYIESLFDLNMVYQPQAYKVVYNKHNQIVENTKINPKARDFVTPCYPHVLAEDLGIARAIINGDGNNCGTSQVQVSEGCSSAGCCSFRVVKGTRIATLDGLIKIEDLSGVKNIAVQACDSLEIAKGVQFAGRGRVYEVKTKDGHVLRCDNNHKFMVVNNGQLVERKTFELNKGDVILRQITYPDVNQELISPDLAEFLGFMHGDGSMTTSRWKIYMTPEEAVRYEPLFRKYVPTSAKTRVHYKSGKTIILVIEGNDPKVIEGIETIDLCTTSCLELRVPEVVMQSSSRVRAAYLKGIFQADGWFTTHMGLTSISKEYIEDIALLLSSLGIDSTIRVNNYFKRHKLEGHKISYYITINKPFQQRFLNLVGFVTKNHVVDELKNRTKSNYSLPASDVEVFRTFPCQQFKDDHISSLQDRRIGRNISDALLCRAGVVLRDELSDLNVSYVTRLLLLGLVVTDKIESVSDLGYEEEMYDVVETESHLCTYGTFITHQCAEGNYCGGHVEKTRERILWECHESKKYSAGYKFKPYSFNVNYLTDYKGMLKEFIQIFPKVTFINMRLEELGRDMDAIVMMKQIGSNRISAPIEGISPRIQNNLLNKCLSREALDNFMTDLIHMKMTDIKVGGIFTGYETDEDFQWLCDYVHSFKMKAKETGGNLPWRLKVTPLVHYPLTPCEYLERKSAKKSYLGEHWLTDEWYEKFRENEVFFKVNGFRYSTFIEQSIVDLGRSLTPMVYKHFIKDLAPVYSLRSVATAEFIEELKSFIDPETFFEARDPEHYISPGHRIHIELMGSYIPRARRLVRAYKAGDIFANEPDIRCLKTYEGAPVKCYSNCIASDPLKIYNDVTLDEEGNLHGEYRELKGCERCQTPEQKKWRLTRPTPQSANSDDIIATPRIPQVQKIRFILSRDSEYDILNPNNTAHTFVTKFLQASDRLLHAFHSIDGHNMFWQSEPAFKYFTSGYQIVDTIWSKDVITEVKSLLESVNSQLKSTKILSVQDIMFDEKLDTKDYNVFVFESSLPREIFVEATLHYKGDIKVDAGMGTLETSTDKSLGTPVFIQKQGKVVGVFIIPVKYSPVNYLSCFLSSTRKTSFQQIVDTTEFSNQFTVRETSTVCKNCGKEKGLISLITGQYLQFGKSCLTKALLTQLSK